jgi:hypothetical protein
MRAFCSLVIGALALAFVASTSAQSWPVSDPAHRAYLCGHGAESGSAKPPAGYTTQLRRAVHDRVGTRHMDTAAAVADLRRQAGCVPEPSAPHLAVDTANKAVVVQ